MHAFTLLVGGINDAQAIDSDIQSFSNATVVQNAALMEYAFIE